MSELEDLRAEVARWKAKYQREWTRAYGLQEELALRAPVYRGWRGYADGSRTDVERWVRASNGDWVSLDSERRTDGDIILEHFSCAPAPVSSGSDLPTLSRLPDDTDQLSGRLLEGVQVMTPEQRERMSNPVFPRVGPVSSGEAATGEAYWASHTSDGRCKYPDSCAQNPTATGHNHRPAPVVTPSAEPDHCLCCGSDGEPRMTSCGFMCDDPGRWHATHPVTPNAEGSE